MNDEYVLTVADLMVEYGFGSCLDFPQYSFMRSIKADCHVGQEADKAIQAGAAFAKTLERHPSVTSKIAVALAEHISILYHG